MGRGSDVSAVMALVYPFLCRGEEGLGGKGGFEGREDGAESGDKAMLTCRGVKMNGVQGIG